MQHTYNEKILGKYTIIEIVEECNASHNGIFKTKFAGKDFQITTISKDNINELTQSTLSHTAQNLSDIYHPNISHLKLDGDETSFYLIREILQEVHEIDNSIFEEYDEEFQYQKLLECYLQIFEAISHIHHKGFYHGNINPGNILVNENNQAFLLDFGKSYFYESLKTNSSQNIDKRFYAPEQIKDVSNVDAKSDIYAFGLCMLKIFLDSLQDEDIKFENLYAHPRDLKGIFEAVTEQFDLEDKEKDLFALIQQMTREEPQNRISLEDFGKKLREIYRNIKQTFNFEINLSDKVKTNYKERNRVSIYEVTKHITDRIKGRKSHWTFGKDKEGKEEIKIACGDLIFCCSTQDSFYLFCFSILDNPRLLEGVRENGIPRDDSFIITFNNNHCNDCDNVQNIKDELKEDFKWQELQNKHKEIDRQAIKSEEDLLEAERKWLVSKKHTQKAKMLEVKRGDNTLVFEIVNKEQDNLESQDSKNLQDLQNQEGINDTKVLQENKTQNIFKPKDKVIIEENGKKDPIKGVVQSYDCTTQKLAIKLPKEYDSVDINNNQRTTIYSISHDYQIEEILWNKKKRALEELKKGNTPIPDLLRKINNPKELEANELVEIKSFIDSSLDKNQQEAVQKALSLDNESEILLIQGPPGTGKTTTITEIVRQLMKRHRHYKILVSSQSNQAVDNVLEKIAKEEDKILRIGNDEKKMSEEAKKFVPQKVLDKIIKDTRERIKNNPIKHQNESIQEELKNLQDEFDKKLQTLSAKIGADKGKSHDYETENLFLKNIRLFFGTLLGISSWKDFREIVFDVAIIDEAGRATLSELLVPCIKARKIILVGDHQQLAPVVDDEVVEHLPRDVKKQEVATSLFERLYERMENAIKDKVEHLKNFRHRLAFNYRAHSSICELYSQSFYEGELQTKEGQDKLKQHHLTCFSKNAIWLDTSKRSDKEDKQQDTGKINHCNAKIVEGTLKILKEKINPDFIQDIGIITPYKAQADLLKNKLKSIRNNFKDSNIELDIGTVDSFQGSDRDIIIYDCVRSSKGKNSKQSQKQRKGGKIDFIADEKRLNVSLSRAKKLLLIVGDMEFLYQASVTEGENPFVKIIEYMQEHKQSYEIIDVAKSKE